MVTTLNRKWRKLGTHFTAVPFHTQLHISTNQRSVSLDISWKARLCLSLPLISELCFCVIRWCRSQEVTQGSNSDTWQIFSFRVCRMIFSTTSTQSRAGSNYVLEYREAFWTCLQWQKEKLTFVSIPDQCPDLIRPNSHRTRTRKASKWDLLLSMGVFTLLASNIKGKTTRPVWIRP